MNIKVPKNDRRKALLVIDVQPATLSAKVLPLIQKMHSYIEQFNTILLLIQENILMKTIYMK
jgi:hypothetical protein